MTLSNAHLAIVDRRKVVDYLLNAEHPDNRGKAKFFGMLGSSVDTGDALIEALRTIAVTGEAILVGSAYGEKYVVNGVLSLHTEKTPTRSTRTIWMIGHGEDAPRLVTAYPGRK